MGLGHSSGFTVEVENQTPHELHLRDPNAIDKTTGVLTKVATSIQPSTVASQVIEGHGYEHASRGAHVENIQYTVQPCQSRAPDNITIQVENESTAVQSNSHDNHTDWVFRLELCAAYHKRNAFYVMEIISPAGEICAREVFREDNALKHRRKKDKTCTVDPIPASGDCPFAVEMIVDKNPRRNSDWWNVRFILRERTLCIVKSACFVERLHFAFSAWKAYRTATVRELQDLAKDLHIHHRNTSIARIMGCSTSTFAAVFGTVGTVASILTAGKFTILLAISAALGAIGKITASGSTMAHSVLSASAQAEANEILQKDHNALRDILVLFETLKHVSRQDLMEIVQDFKKQNTANFPEKCIILSNMYQTGNIGSNVGYGLLYQPIISAKKLAGELSATGTGPHMATSGGENVPQLLLEAIGIQVSSTVLDSAIGTISLVCLPRDIKDLVEAADIVASDRGTEITELLQSTAEALEKEIPSQQDFDILVNKFISNI